MASYKSTFTFERVVLKIEVEASDTDSVEQACEKLAAKLGATYLYSEQIDPTTGKPK